MRKMPDITSLQIETALYAADLNDSDRLSACLAAHACLMNRNEVPRCFLRPDADMRLKDWNHAIRCCLLSLPSQVAIETASTLRYLGIESDCSEVTCAERIISISTVEGIIFDGWGEGSVHYEMARMTPFTVDDILLRVSVLQTAWDAESRHFFDCMRRRSAHQARIRAEHHESEISSLQCGYERVLRRKVEAEWQKYWLSHKHYQEDTDAQFISTLTILKDGA